MSQAEQQIDVFISQLELAELRMQLLSQSCIGKLISG